MQIIGLTGGMAAGKSTVSAMLRRAGVPVFDADACVRALQAKGGRALPEINAAFPGTVHAGVLDRVALRRAVIGDVAQMKRLEAILHPMVRRARDAFVRRCRRNREALCVLDVPLLMETGQDRTCDQVIVVIAPKSTRLSRIRKRGRGGARMSPEQASALIARQMPDQERRRRADFVIRTGLSRAEASRQVLRLLKRLRENA